MSETGVSFLRKTRNEIQTVPIVDGQLIFETDQGNNGKIYTDIATDRIAIGGKTEVVDELNSISVIDALSANKGRELNTSIENIIDGTAVVANTIQTYTHSGDTLTGSGVNGQFKATSSTTLTSAQVGTAENYTACTIVNGDDTELEIVSGRWYQFIKDGTVLNFSKASGLKLKVVGGETQPESPSDGTIWVETDVDIGEIYITPTEPTDISDGDIWLCINTGIDTFTNITPSAKPLICLPLVEAKQYVNASWEQKYFNVFAGDWELPDYFQNGADLAWGNIVVAAGGLANSGQPDWYLTTDGIMLAVTGANKNSGTTIVQINGIDVTNYKSIKFVYSRSLYGSSGNYRNVYISVNTTVQACNTIGNNLEAVFDVSDLSGAVYLKIANTNSGGANGQSSYYGSKIVVHSIEFLQ